MMWKRGESEALAEELQKTKSSPCGLSDLLPFQWHAALSGLHEFGSHECVVCVKPTVKQTGSYSKAGGIASVET